MRVCYIAESTVSLTFGVVYEVLDIQCGLYCIKDNTEEEYFFYPEDFEMVEG